MEISEILKAVEQEVERAVGMFGPMLSPHEGLAVIQEEFEEFKDEVYAHNLVKNRDRGPEMKTEVLQLAAMCVRFVYDCKL